MLMLDYGTGSDGFTHSLGAWLLGVLGSNASCKLVLRYTCSKFASLRKGIVSINSTQYPETTGAFCNATVCFLQYGVVMGENIVNSRNASAHRAFSPSDPPDSCPALASFTPLGTLLPSLHTWCFERARSEEFGHNNSIAPTTHNIPAAII